MPIIFNATEKAWECKDLTAEEEASLKTIATDIITDYFGEVIAKRAMEYAHPKRTLEDIPTENMGNA